MSNFHKLHRINTEEYQQEIKNIHSQQPLNKAPVEYSPSTQEGGATTQSIKNPNENWSQVREQELPNGLIYKQFQRNDFSSTKDGQFQHHLVDPSTGKSVSILRTTALLPGHPDYSFPQEHTIVWAQTDPSQKGKGLGKQAYIATLVHGRGVGQLNSDTLLSPNGHKAWSSFKQIPGLKVNLAPYATDQDATIDSESYKEAGRRHHTMRVHNEGELNHDKMFPPVDLSVGEEKLAASEKVVGGKGDRKKDSQFSAKEVEMGHKVEMEHTNSPRIAAEITRDHLTENPKYYSRLRQAGLADELKKGKIGPECKTKLKAYSRRKGWQYPSAVVHLQAGKICGSKTKSEDLENNLRKDLRRWVKEKWANPKGETHHGSGKSGWRPTVRVSGKTPQTWGEMTAHQKKKKIQNKKKANRRGGGWSTHESGKKQVWNTKKSDLLEKIEFLEKAEPPPTFIGQISPNGRKKAIGIPGGEIVWDMHPRLKPEVDARIIQKARDWLKTQPTEHHPLLKQFINGIISDPYRHVRYGSNEKNGPIMPRLRHVEEMVTNHPEANLIVHSPESMSLYVGRHGASGGISHFKHELKKGLVKSENLFYNGLNGSYTDEFGNTYKFSDGNGHELSKSERDALGTEDGLLRQFRRLAKTDEATIRRISLFLRHDGVRGDAGSRRNEEGHGAPHGDGALLSMMNDVVFDDPWDQAKHDREHLDSDDSGNGGEIIFDDPWDQAKHDREHLDIDSLDLNKAEESDNPIFSRATWRDENGQIQLPQLYRHYKNSPHHPVSLALKYLVHRTENADKYNNASQESKNQMDSDFLQLHQAGGAAHKNIDVTAKHLNDFYDSHAQRLIPQLLDHKRKLGESIINNFPDAVKNINGEPHIALTRGLNTNSPGKDHALASYADTASTGFGTHMHHRWVPLNNLWFSYETGPKNATSEKFGNEREYLVSPHETKPAKKNDVKPVFGGSGQFHDFNFESLQKLQDGMIDHNDPVLDLLENHAHRIHPKTLNYVMDRFGKSAADAISRNNHIDYETTQRVLGFNDPNINFRLAENPSLHPLLHEKLANDEDWGVRQALAKNPNLHSSLHEKLANDHIHFVRKALAENPNLHPSAHEKLANDGQMGVRQALAKNPSLHPSLHEKLANDEDWGVRLALAKNPNLHSSLHEKLANDENEDVRLALAKNPNLHPSAHEKLANDENEDVRLALARNPNLHPSAHEKLVSDENEDVRFALARNPNLHPSAHEKLANDESHFVRVALAKNPKLHPLAHEKLANDEDSSVRRALARNPNLHPSLHEKLANDQAEEVRNAMTSNPNYVGGIKKSENLQIKLKKGAQGDWKKEKYVLRYHAPKGQGAYGLHTITAHDSKGNIVGELSAEDLNDGTFQANMVEVHPEHRRKGIAGAMYNHMEMKTGLKAIPDLEAQTSEGAALWRQKNRPFGKSEEIFTSLQKASASKKLLGMLGLMAATSIPITQPKQTFSPRNDYSTNQTIQKEVDLRSISDTESGNRDKALHDMVMTGLNAGSRAIGRYGMMPLTAKDLVAKKPALKKYKNVLKYSDSQLADFMHKNPQFQKEVASAHYDRLSNIFNGNLAHIAHAWLNGVEGTKKAIKAGKNIDSHWHVQKVINARNNILGIKTEDKKQKVNKKPKKVQMPKSSKIIIP